MKLSRSAVSGHMHFPGSKVIGMIVWLITALGAINWGLVPMGHDIFGMAFMQNMASLIKPLQYIIGVSGVVSLVMFFGACTCSSSHK